MTEESTAGNSLKRSQIINCDSRSGPFGKKLEIPGSTCLASWRKRLPARKAFIPNKTGSRITPLIRSTAAERTRKRPLFLDINLVMEMILTVFAELARRNNDFTNTKCQLSPNQLQTAQRLNWEFTADLFSI
jgi:hypothetical protein